MKILLISATYYPSANGVAVAVKNLFEELKRQGHEVYLLAPNTFVKTKDPEGLFRYFSIPNPVVKDYPIGLLPLSPQIFKLLTETKFDIVHAQHPFQVSFMADIVSSFYKIPFVYTYHTYIDKYIKLYLNFLPKKLVKTIAEYTGSGVLRKADLIVVASNSVKKNVERLGARGNMAIIPVGIPKFKKVALSKVNLRKKYKVPQNKKILLCVSRVGKEKNIMLLLKTMKIMPDDYFLVLAGTGPQISELKKFVSSNNLSGKVKFLGKIDYSKISDPYSLADIFVFPSITETQGVVFLEACYFGLPIVAADSVVNREWVNKDFGFIASSNPEGFKSAILKVEDDPGFYSKNAKEFAQKYTVEKTTLSLVDAYKEAIKNWKPRKTVEFDIREKLKNVNKYMKKMMTN